MGIGGLQRFGDGDKEADGLRVFGLEVEVAELADQIDPINGLTVTMLMIAAIKDDLELIP